MIPITESTFRVAASCDWEVNSLPNVIPRIRPTWMEVGGIQLLHCAITQARSRRILLASLAARLASLNISP
ncbi:MAG: hypothetical protein ACFFEA_08475, partial [Candidatus Thorarchaeota archaeon]